jgi:hypothetical protein
MAPADTRDADAVEQHGRGQPRRQRERGGTPKKPTQYNRPSHPQGQAPKFRRRKKGTCKTQCIRGEERRRDHGERGSGLGGGGGCRQQSRWPLMQFAGSRWSARLRQPPQPHARPPVTEARQKLRRNRRRPARTPAHREQHQRARPSRGSQLALKPRARANPKRKLGHAALPRRKESQRLQGPPCPPSCPPRSHLARVAGEGVGLGRPSAPAAVVPNSLPRNPPHRFPALPFTQCGMRQGERGPKRSTAVYRRKS